MFTLNLSELSNGMGALVLFSEVIDKRGHLAFIDTSD